MQTAAVLFRLRSASGTTTVQNLTNGYDPAGNITAITDYLAASRTQAMTYDDLNR